MPRFGVSILQEQQLARKVLVNAQAETINQVVSRRFVNLLQTRTRVLDEDLDDLDACFAEWRRVLRPRAMRSGLLSA